MLCRSCAPAWRKLRLFLEVLVQEREAEVESRLRPRLHALEVEAASGSQDAALERAQEALQVRARLEREHQEAGESTSDIAGRGARRGRGSGGGAAKDLLGV